MRAKSMTDYVSGPTKDLKIPATLHTLRHWKHTELNRQGVDLPTAADRGVHSVGVMAETYLHTSDDRAAAAGELVAAVVGKVLTGLTEVSGSGSENSASPSGSHPAGSPTRQQIPGSTRTALA
jgi:hypothetical protein